MAKSTVLNEFFNVIKFKTDQASLNQAQNSIMKFKSIATKALGFLGVGISLSWLKGITEEFGDINDAISGATEGLGEQSEIQKKILASAQDCRESYGKMAGYVDDLVMKNQKLFPIDDAVKFTSLMEKLEKGSGKESNLASTMSLFSKATTSGSFDKSTFAQLAEKAPEVLNTITEATGKSKKQLESMAAAGTLSVSTIKDAIFSAEDAIQKKFDGLDLSVNDAITHIRNSWGYWFEDIDSTYKITGKLSRLFIDFSDKLLTRAKKIKSWLDDVAKKMGGYEKLLKLIAMAAAAVYIAMNATAITKFLEGVVGLLGKINLQTALAAAKWLALFLVIEDIWTFLQGGDSVIGRLLKDAGVDTDKLREKINWFFQQVPKLFEKIGKFLSEHKTGLSMAAGLIATLLVLIAKVPPMIEKIWKAGSLAMKALSFVGLSPHILLIIGLILALAAAALDFWNFLKGKDSLIGKALEGMGVDTDKLREKIFGFVDTVKQKVSAFKDWISGIFDWIGQKVEWARGVLDGIRSSMFGKGSSTDEDGFGGSKGGDTSGGSKGGSFSSSAWGAGRCVSPKTAANNPVTNNKSVTIKQENNQQYTFKVDSTDAADKLHKEVNSQSSQSADDLARSLNFGR